jgi:hypothetical protein
LRCGSCTRHQVPRRLYPFAAAIRWRNGIPPLRHTPASTFRSSPSLLDLRRRLVGPPHAGRLQRPLLVQPRPRRHVLRQRRRLRQRPGRGTVRQLGKDRQDRPQQDPDRRQVRLRLLLRPRRARQPHRAQAGLSPPTFVRRPSSNRSAACRPTTSTCTWPTTSSCRSSATTCGRS